MDERDAGAEQYTMANQETQSNAGRTAFGVLYGDTYWGQGGVASPAVCANRDALGPHISQARRGERPEYVARAAFGFSDQHPNGEHPRYRDHVEFYKDVNGDWIVMTSPYYGAVERGKQMPNWALLPPMYSTNAATYACRRPKRHGRTGPMPKVGVPWNPL